jgi:hypothetical protein
MDQTAVVELAKNLLIVVGSLMQQPTPIEPPEVRVLPAAQIERMVCKGPCRIKAFFVPGEGIYLSDALDLEKDAMSQSILLHELVHFVQNTTGAFDAAAANCEAWYAQELEAYEVQNAFLRRNGLRLMWMDRLPKGMCTKDAAPDAASEAR